MMFGGAMRCILLLLYAAILQGCYEKNKSVDYFLHHLHEAMDVSDTCLLSKKPSDECKNANEALYKAEWLTMDD